MPKVKRRFSRFKLWDGQLVDLGPRGFGVTISKSGDAFYCYTLDSKDDHETLILERDRLKIPHMGGERENRLTINIRTIEEWLAGTSFVSALCSRFPQEIGSPLDPMHLNDENIWWLMPLPDLGTITILTDTATIDLSPLRPTTVADTPWQSTGSPFWIAFDQDFHLWGVVFSVHVNPHPLVFPIPCDRFQAIVRELVRQFADYPQSNENRSFPVT